MASRPAAARSHPLGVLPLGQLLFSEGRHSLREGLGALLGALSDELLASVLMLLEAPMLARLALVCRALHVFSHVDELWKPRVLEAVGGAFTYEHSWRSTYASAVRRAPAPASAAHACCRQWPPFYSDFLFRPWLCATQPLPEWWLRTPASSTAIERVDGRALTPEQFSARYDRPAKPVILSGLARDWAALRAWRRQELLGRFGSAEFVVGEMGMRLDDFFAYCDRAADDPPLILFDKAFAARAPELAGEYDASPSPFPPDHFALLPADARPDWRWLIIGGARSGSTWHVDPNRTSAWNACVAGGKKWLLTPPERPPPGVSASEDGATIEAPVSVVEWMSGYLPQARRELGAQLHEACVGPGDVVFIPRGWWHTVLNTEDDTVAVTHNFASDPNLAEVLQYTNPARGAAEELVSGVPRAERAGLHGRLVQALREHRPEALERATRPEAVAAARAALAAGLRRAGDAAAAAPRAPSLWTLLTHAGERARACSTCSSSEARAASSPAAPEGRGGAAGVGGAETACRASLPTAAPCAQRRASERPCGVPGTALDGRSGALPLRAQALPVDVAPAVCGLPSVDDHVATGTSSFKFNFADAG